MEWSNFLYLCESQVILAQEMNIQINSPLKRNIQRKNNFQIKQINFLLDINTISCLFLFNPIILFYLAVIYHQIMDLILQDKNSSLDISLRYLKVVH